MAETEGFCKKRYLITSVLTEKSYITNDSLLIQNLLTNPGELYIYDLKEGKELVTDEGNFVDLEEDSEDQNVFFDSHVTQPDDDDTPF